MTNYRPTDYVRTVPDYPVAGVNFYDMNSLFASEIWGCVVSQMCTQMQYGSMFGYVTHIAGIESRGFVVGQALASEMLKPFVMIRKSGSKYPGELLSQSYDLEYGTDTLVLQTGILGHTSRVLIVDDLIATGGSVLATKKLIEQTGASVVGAASILNLKYLNQPELESLKIYSAEDVLK
jgi:adenine phosphoribosyltransferase